MCGAARVRGTRVCPGYYTDVCRCVEDGSGVGTSGIVMGVLLVFRCRRLEGLVVVMTFCVLLRCRMREGHVLGRKALSWPRAEARCSGPRFPLVVCRAVRERGQGILVSVSSFLLVQRMILVGRERGLMPAVFLPANKKSARVCHCHKGTSTAGLASRDDHGFAANQRSACETLANNRKTAVVPNSFFFVVDVIPLRAVPDFIDGDE